MIVVVLIKLIKKNSIFFLHIIYIIMVLNVYIMTVTACNPSIQADETLQNVKDLSLIDPFDQLNVVLFADKRTQLYDLADIYLTLTTLDHK